MKKNIIIYILGITLLFTHLFSFATATTSTYSIVDNFSANTGAIHAVGKLSAHQNGIGTNFNSTGNYTLAMIGIALAEYGTANYEYVIDLYNGSTLPDQAIITSNTHFDGTTATGTYKLYNFTFNDTPITEHTELWVIIRRTDNSFDGSNYLGVDGSNAAAPYDLVQDGGAGFGVSAANWQDRFVVYEKNGIPEAKAGIRPTIAYTNDTISGYCNVNDTDLDVLLAKYKYYKNGAIIVDAESQGIENSTLNETEDSYKCTGECSWGFEANLERMFDGNDLTFAQNIGANSYIYWNYTIPSGIDGALWVIRTRARLTTYSCYNGASWEDIISATGTGTPVEYFHEYIPQNCLDNGDSVLQFRAYGRQDPMYEDRVYWYFQNLASESQVSTVNIPSTLFSKGDNITLSCGANNTIDEAWDNVTLTISNRAPDITNVDLVEDTIYIGTNATGNWSFSDIDGDSDSSYYRWYVNGVLNESGRYVDTLPTFDDFADVGDNITFSVLGNDGTDNSTGWINSTTFTVQSSDTCTYSGTGDWNITIGDNCTLSEDTDLGSNILQISGDSGTLTINASITAKEIHYETDDKDGDSVLAVLKGAYLGPEVA